MPSIRTKVGGALLCLCAACSRAPTVGAPATTRLLERAREIVVEAGGAAPAFPGRRSANLGLPPSKLVASVARSRPENGRDHRPAFVVTPGTRLSWTGPLAGPHKLRVALGALAPESAEPAELRFRVAAGGVGEESEQLAEVALAASSDGAWRELEIDLPEQATIRLELAVDGAPGSFAAWATPELVPARRRPDRPNLILISLDTLRADRLGAYGYAARPTSPNLDRFAARSVRFAWAISQAPWTRPSHRSMLTGVHPASHGGLEPVPISLVLWNAGYRTRALTSGGQVDAKLGFDEGFDSYAAEQHWLRDPERALADLEVDRERELFLFLHTYEIHDPYEDRRFLPASGCELVGKVFDNGTYQRVRKRMTDADRACVSAFYDGDIAFTDERVGRLLTRLEALRRLDDSIVIVTSDHGEQLWEHGGWRHGAQMYDHQIHVPLLVHLPPALRARFGRAEPGSRPGSAIDESVALVDLAPTIYELLGVPVRHAMHGRSLVPLLAGGRGEPREIFSENTNTSFERKSLRTDRTKFIRGFPKRARGPAPKNEFQLFDLRRDPGERRNLAAEHPEIVRALAARLDALTGGRLGKLDAENPADLDPALREELRALGYLGGN